jgi:hypothetical protein
MVGGETRAVETTTIRTGAGARDDEALDRSGPRVILQVLETLLEMELSLLGGAIELTRGLSVHVPREELVLAVLVEPLDGLPADVIGEG